MTASRNVLTGTFAWACKMISDLTESNIAMNAGTAALPTDTLLLTCMLGLFA